jgi:uncharacterized DUF497 family protein
MEIVWDELKRLRNQAKHRFDFAELPVAFFETAKILPGRDGRLMAIGLHQDAIVTAIFRPLGSEGLSLVSLRRASRKERSVL